MEPGALSQKLGGGEGGGEVLVEPVSCTPAGVRARVCICLASWGQRPRLLARVLGAGGSVVSAQLRDASWWAGGRARRLALGLGGGGWRALPTRGQKNIRRRLGWAALQQLRAGARGEEVSAFRPPSRWPFGESPPTPAG